MAYVNAQDPRRRIATLGSVAALHAALGYALVTGLAGTAVTTFETIIRGTNIPLPEPSDPPPPDRARDHKADPAKRDDTTIFVPPPSDTHLGEGGPVFEGGGAETGSGTGLGDAEFPVGPVPPPLPGLAPRAPSPRGNAGN